MTRAEVLNIFGMLFLIISYVAGPIASFVARLFALVLFVLAIIRSAEQ